MCGIVAVLNKNKKYTNLSGVLIDSLRRLEYRGYDSAGIAVIDKDNKIQRMRSTNRIDGLAKEVTEIEAITGIGHTRWATHGGISIQNAHPQMTGCVSVVHNGIVENYTKIKDEMLENKEFESETDTEVLSQLISKFMDEGQSFKDSFFKTMSIVEGSSAVVALCDKEPGTVIGAMYGSPLAIGYNDDQIFIASDAIALYSLSENVIYMNSGETVVASGDSFTIYDKDMNEITKKPTKIEISSYSTVNKSEYESYMLSEIHEEPSALLNTYNNFATPVSINDYKEIFFIACGTSYYAGLLGKYWLEDIAKIKVNVEIASEFRYRNPVLSKDCLYIFISQSGETIDTLSAMRLINNLGYDTLSIVNVPNSSLYRESKYKIETNAGFEMAVASTKAFICQALTMLLMVLGKEKVDINAISKAMQNVIDKKDKLINMASKLSESRIIMYMGRGTSYPISLEGALKMKELSYISSESCPSGEIKHGPIAIVDKSVYTVVLAPNDRYYEKTISNTQEILARNGPVLLIGSKASTAHLKNVDIFEVDDTDDISSPFIITTAVHILAYYTAKSKGLDIDKPRNLAKSVTVE